MKIIPKRKKSRNVKKRIDLKVNIIEGKDLVLTSPKSCNIVSLAFNGQTKRTHKIKHTANPTFNTSLQLRLSGYNLGGPILHIGIFDKHRRYSIYLGELRLNIIDLFEDNERGLTRTIIPPKWYRLHSSKTQETFVTGSIKVGFELKAKSDIVKNFKIWQTSLVNRDKSIKLNDQDYYSDTDTDVESLLVDEPRDAIDGFKDINLSSDSFTTPSTPEPQLLSQITSRSSSPYPDSSLTQHSNSAPPSSSTTTSTSTKSQTSNLLSTATTNSATSSGNGLLTPKPMYLQPPPVSGSTASNSNYDSYYSSDFSMSDNNQQIIQPSVQSLARKRTSHHLKSGSSIAGVVFLEIESADGLPPFKRFIQKGFDMDPFVVISFGKKTFRTSWRKHTLTPVWNQTLAFEVLTNERHYDLVFNILDKDHISFHDKVAFGSISLSGIEEESDFRSFDLPLTLFKEDLDYHPSLKFRIKYKNYSGLKDALWQSVLSKYGETLDIIQLDMFLDNLNINEELISFYKINDKTMSDVLTIPEIIKVLQHFNVQIERCPLCGKRKQNDMITHVAICSAKGDKLKSFASAGLASKRWYSKVLIKFAYGKYAFGKNNANILVQDRLTGFIIEEKMALYVRLGIRLLYKGKGADSRRIKTLLKNLSVRQGARFDSPSSVKDIDSFIKFHGLDLSECESKDFKTFNDFFYRKLRQGSRPPESNDEKIVVSPADSRCTAFNNVSSATKVWIKSRSFSIAKLLGEEFKNDLESFEDCSIAVFRLAPQDYHRFHSPVNGVIGEPVYIQGEYYTVNPMAIRSDLDVFGENVRVIVPIETEQFGKVIVIAVGAMMVGSTVLTVGKGDDINRADELGYFKFGGSTILTLFTKGSMEFDSDLVGNSNDCIETLVRVGMSVGHKTDIPEFQRARVDFDEKSDEAKLKIIRTITGGDNDHPWELLHLNVNSDEELDEEDDEED
ncbi:Phosphatidylserine decarboxylase proenzyme 2 [Wickerhamomyces ciferrii]|uniref:Phosphatidylserine decarboxylase proenzyme 2 n=1 Tax=Wickerhamomyces ciferrii (strain ATCC 14091 / BCRC 22168 / CBS 111 / JCM 3599 / NBRC 0793 / NRRL Y-1031 F-60-10) TaxID=1206466 RepID=K0KFC5_WICCF|nr:Phosphatidylserine decarboxylase proenzyme 2 [Wickerhamomyces ciferrii]CCH41646.1 Phosphatidylserine decarboxylase proenzyme 2 [Wickerhamomyces ciferrii]